MTNQDLLMTQLSKLCYVKINSSFKNTDIFLSIRCEISMYDFSDLLDVVSHII